MSRKTLPAEGMAQDTLFETLEAFKAEDLDWHSGKIFAYVYDAGREAEKVGKDAFRMFLTENALDPTAFPSLLRFENDLVAMALSHLNAPEGGSGTFTSGGTESIMLAVKAAREHARQHRPEITAPEMILPVTAHAAFHKSAKYLGIKVVTTPVDPVSYEAIPGAIKEALTDQTILVVASTPSYAHGVIDPVAPIAAIAQEAGVLCHVDACVGGFLLPYFRRHGADIADFDFSVPGVTSMSMDFHKYAFTPKGSSVVLYRDASLRQQQYFACAGWTGYTVINPAVQSSKSGGPLAGAWAVLHHFGDAGYAEVAGRVRDASLRLREGIEALEDLQLMGDPRFCMLAFESKTINVFALADELKERGWYVQAQHRFGEHPQNIHLSIHPANVDWVEPFLKDLGEAVAAVRTQPAPQLPEGMMQAIQAMAGTRVAPEQLMGMLAMAGISGSALPSRMADINGLLNELPPDFKEQLLTVFLGHLFSPSEA